MHRTTSAAVTLGRLNATGRHAAGWSAIGLSIGVMTSACGGADLTDMSEGSTVTGASVSAADAGDDADGGGSGACLLSNAEVVAALQLWPTQIEESFDSTTGSGESACVYNGTLRYTPESRDGPLGISIVVFGDAKTGAEVLELTRRQGESVDIGDEAAVDSHRAIMSIDGRYYQVNFSSRTTLRDESGATAVLEAIAAKLG